MNEWTEQIMLYLHNGILLSNKKNFIAKSTKYSTVLKILETKAYIMTAFIWDSKSGKSNFGNKTPIARNQISGRKWDVDCKGSQGIVRWQNYSRYELG